MVKMQENSDKMMYTLEEKRMKMKEERMKLDAQLRREERQFELQMIQMLAQLSSTPCHFPSPVPHLGYTPRTVLKIQVTTHMQPRKDCNVYTGTL